MTIDQALEEAKKYIDPDLLPARSTIYGWIKAGAVSGRIKRQNKGKAGGIKDIFPADLPIEIAVVSYLFKVHGISLKKIAAGRIWVTGLRNQKKVEHMAPPEDLKIAMGSNFLIIHYWWLYFVKLKKGYRADEPFEIIVTHYSKNGIKTLVSEEVKKSEIDKITFRRIGPDIEKLDN